MKKYKVDIEASGTWRDSQDIEVEAENEDDAQELAWDKFKLPDVRRCDVNDYEIFGIVESVEKK